MEVLGLDLSKVGLGDALEAMAEAWLDAQGVEVDPPHWIRQDLWECLVTVLRYPVLGDSFCDSRIDLSALIEVCIESEPDSGNLDEASISYTEAVNKLCDLGVLVSKENGLLIMDRCNLYAKTEWENRFHVTLPFIPGAVRYGESSDIRGTVVPLHLVTNYLAEMKRRSAAMSTTRQSGQGR